MIDEETLVELYHIKGLSQRQVAEKLGTTKWEIRKSMNHHNLNSRSKSEARRQWFLKQPIPLYIDDEGHEYWYDQTGQHDWDETSYTFIHRVLALIDNEIEDLDGMVVHHKNFIPWGNRPENLEVMTPGEHTKLHEAHRNGEQMYEVV